MLVGFIICRNTARKTVPAHTALPGWETLDGAYISFYGMCFFWHHVIRILFAMRKLGGQEHVGGCVRCGVNISPHFYLE